MTLKESIVKYLDEIITDNEFFLVDITVSEFKSNRKISVFMDSDSGITIEQCSQISRKLGNKLEADIDEAFTLDVSSPGLDSPLKLDRQYLKNIGRNLKITKINQAKVNGKLVKFENGNVTLEIKNKKETETLTLPLSEIEEAKVTVSFK